MRILLINNLFGKRARGGAERIVEIEAEALAAAGHRVLVVSGAPDQEGLVSGVCLPDGACQPGTAPASYWHAEITPPNFYFYGEGRDRSFLARLAWLVRDLFNFAAARQLETAFKDFQPDVVHTHNLIGLGLQLPRLLKRRGLRHVHTVHDVQLVDSTGQILLTPPAYLRVARFLHARLFSAVFGSPDVVIFPSEFLKRFYEVRGFFRRSQRVVVPNPAPTPTPGERVMPEHPMFLFVGQLEEHKGLRLLLDAWRAAKLAGATLEIIGEGSLRGEVERAAAQDVSIIYRGRLANEVVQATHARASFLVLPSLVLENSPTVILEALAAGTPVIAMNQGGIPELVKEGETGYLVNTAGGVAAWAEALRRAAAVDLVAWQALARQAKQSVAERSVDSYSQRLLDLFRASSPFSNPSP
jgi:glycosyltransferase involved in cell wall biosynthesis